MKWEEVCTPKEGGGLGVKDIVKFNRALLGKWRWWVLSEETALWWRVLNEKYGGVVELGSEESFQIGSNWWVDIGRVASGEREGKWFEESISKVVGCGIRINFWEDKWLGGEILKDKFKRVYEISNQKNWKVAEMGGWEGDEWLWNLVWRRNFFEWELPLVNDFLQELGKSIIKQGIKDSWRWKHDPENGFTVKEAYKAQLNLAECQSLEKYAKIWNAYAPSKVLALGWRVLRRRLPTLDNLAKRGVIQDLRSNGVCKLCNVEIETVDHIFFGCSFAYDVWCLCLKWLGVFGPLPSVGSSHLFCFESWGGVKRRMKTWRSIWLACIWSLWMHCNAVFFRGAQPNKDVVLENLKRLSWMWIKHIGEEMEYQFVNWNLEPRRCLNDVNLAIV